MNFPASESLERNDDVVVGIQLPSSTEQPLFLFPSEEYAARWSRQTKIQCKVMIGDHKEVLRRLKVEGFSTVTVWGRFGDVFVDWPLPIDRFLD